MEKIILLVILGITIILGISSTKHKITIPGTTETLEDSISNLLNKWRVNYMYKEEVLNEILNSKYRDNLKYLLAIGKVESNFNKYALGDPFAGYSYGYFQINLNDGENHDKISTLEMAIREGWYPYYELRDNAKIKQEMAKIRQGENSFLYNTDIQFHLANNIINIIKRKIKDQGYEVKPEYIAYMWNAGVYSDIINIGVWATNYSYLQKFNKAYQEVEDALNLLLK